ncbi:peptidoglycan-binding protein [Oceanirhabdus seepicola]|uniref:Peptidoglycan-binding protein n=1 Tax=Oceanirhabdus seepicola TaxID=2828781 RepID=A0A9J6P849_9CLOT|nr:peptidoglycan-binding protein [Oceanirhabdus seepicola]MCM1992081.1 peptidoglycan-binding protein [Oceanirhabdus seepicola]
MPDIGNLKVQVYGEDGFKPIEGATCTITGQNGSTVKEQVKSNDSGICDIVEVDTPPIEYSMEPTGKIPYGLCNVFVDADGYEGIEIKGCQVFPNREAIQIFPLKKIGRNGKREKKVEVIEVKENRLIGNFPPKIPEDPVKDLEKLKTTTGLVVLEEVVVPEFIVVHDGAPKKAAKDYTVRFKEYIKNVASSEIYATWPYATIKANILCILSFTLNRIYTEWYTGKGYKFQITSSTAYDHAFSYRRNIYDNISQAVDEIFTTYVKLMGRKQPLLTQYCDGIKVQCPGWMTQWGSKSLGDKGKNEYQIIRDFYGSEIQFVRAKEVTGIPKSYPGYPLKIGSRGAPVRTIQTYLNRISVNYPAIPKVKVDSIYGTKTAESVKKFQSIFNLKQTGVVDYATWYSISNIYVAVTKIAELRNEYTGNKIFIPPNSHRSDDVPKIEYPCDY